MKSRQICFAVNTFFPQNFFLISGKEKKKVDNLFFQSFSFLYLSFFVSKLTVFSSLVYMQEIGIPKPQLGPQFTCFPVTLQVMTELGSCRSLNNTFDKLSRTTKIRQRFSTYSLRKTGNSDPRKKPPSEISFTKIYDIWKVEFYCYIFLCRIIIIYCKFFLLFILESHSVIKLKFNRATQVENYPKYRSIQVKF